MKQMHTYDLVMTVDVAVTIGASEHIEKTSLKNQHNAFNRALKKQPQTKQ